MRRIPHLYLPPPWPEGPVVPPSTTVRHLRVVLRLADGASVTYTDGRGTMGTGRWIDGAVDRGDEQHVDDPSPLVLAVAPPRRMERLRFVVEKLAELGVPMLRWLVAERAQARLPRADKVQAWAIGALQQSRGAHLLDVSGPVGWSELPRPLVVAQPGGRPLVGVAPPATIAIGPEGGFSSAEIPPDAERVDLGERILRVETAALVAAAAMLVGR